MQDQSASNGKAYISAIVYTIIIGFSFMFLKVGLNENVSPIDLLAHRFTVAFSAICIIIVFNRLFKISDNLHLNLTKKDFIAILPIGVLYPTLFFLFQVFGLYYSSSLQAGIVQASTPVFTLILATIVLKERSTKLQKLSIFLCVVGLLYITYYNKADTGDASNVKGIVLILLSSLSFALYNIAARRLTQRFSLFTITFVMTLLGFVVFNLIAVSNHLISGTLFELLTPYKSRNFVITILYLGVLSSLLTAFLSNYALSKIEAFKMSVFSNLATVITVLAGVLILNEKINISHIIGSIVIISGVIGANYFNKK